MNSRVWVHITSSFKHHASLMILTTLVLTGSFFVSGGLLLAGQNMQNILTLWGESLQMSVYLKEDATPEQTQGLREKFGGDSRIGKADWVDREKALSSFQDQMASYAPDLLKDAQLLKFIPQSFQIQLSEKVSSALQLETLKQIADELKGNEAVDEVSYGQEWVKTYSAIVKAVQNIGTWLIVLLVTASLFIVSNSISSSIQQRRGEIEVLELVGASKRFIRGPFLAEGFFVGLISGVFALGLLTAGFSALQSQFQAQIAFLQIASHLNFFSALNVLAFLATASGIGLVSAYLSMRRLNDGWASAKNQKGRG